MGTPFLHARLAALQGVLTVFVEFLIKLPVKSNCRLTAVWLSF